MKKTVALLLAVMMVFALTACGSNTGNQSESTGNAVPESGISESTEALMTSESEIAQSPADSQQESSDIPESNGSDMSESGSESSPEPTQSTTTAEGESTLENDDGQNILVAFFSRAGENYNVGVIEKGNTHIIAEMIAEQTGGDLFHIQTVTPYPEDYRECTNVAQQELRDNARPELAATVENFENYDTVFLGYPNWWGDMPMAVYTFMESYDFSGKTIVPFATHEGSGLSSTESSIATVCSGAEVLDGLAVRGSVAQNSQSEASEAVVNWLRDTGFAE